MNKIIATVCALAMVTAMGAVSVGAVPKGPGSAGPAHCQDAHTMSFVYQRIVFAVATLQVGPKVEPFSIPVTPTAKGLSVTDGAGSTIETQMLFNGQLDVEVRGDFTVTVTDEKGETTSHKVSGGVLSLTGVGADPAIVLLDEKGNQVGRTGTPGGEGANPQAVMVSARGFFDVFTELSVWDDTDIIHDHSAFVFQGVDWTAIGGPGVNSTGCPVGLLLPAVQ